MLLFIRPVSMPFKSDLIEQLRNNKAMQIKEISEEVFCADEPLVNVSRREIEFMKQRVKNTEHKRIRLCAHMGEEDALHEMFIVLSKETYIRPAKHLGKAESLHVIEGLAQAVFLDEMGGITDVVLLGDYLSGQQFYFRIRESFYHTLLVKSDFLVFHEVTKGPFDRSDTLFPTWAPEENDIANRNIFMKHISKSVECFIQNIL